MKGLERIAKENNKVGCIFMYGALCNSNYFFISEEPKKEEVAQEEDFHYRYMDSDEDDDAMAHYEAFLIGKESAYAEDKEFDIISNQHVSLISTMPHDILIMIRMGTER